MEFIADLVGVSIGAEGRRAEARVVGQAVVGEAELGDEIRHVEIAEMLRHRSLDERATAVLVDGLRAGEAGILEVGVVGEEVAPVVVQCDHQRVVIGRKPVQQHPARVEVVDIGVPHGEERRHRLDRRMARAGEKEGGCAEIGDAGRADDAGRPGLGDDPLGDLAIVVAFGRRAETVTRAEARPGAAHVDDDEGIAARNEEVTVLCGVWRVLGTGGSAVL
jgi:hypothetical protein